MRQSLARAYTREEILRFLKQRLEAKVAIDGSVMKILWSETRRDRARAAVSLLDRDVSYRELVRRG